MSLLDWLTDIGSSPLGGAMGEAGDTSGLRMPPPATPMPPVQMMGSDQAALRPPQPNPGAMARPVDPSMTDIAGGMQGAGPAAPPPPVPDPSMTDIGAGMQGAGPAPQPPVPMPVPRPAGADAALPPNAAPVAGGPPPGPPMQIAPQNVPPTAPTADAQGFRGIIGRALGVSPEQGRQVGAGLAAGLKGIGQGAGLGQGKFASFAGGVGTAMEGANAEAKVQQKQATDYLKAAIDAKKQGDEAGYKQNYLQYLAAKLKADTDKAASKEAGANKNDTPTQLYLSAQRLVQPERNALNKRIEQMRKDGADPAEIAKVQTEGETAIAGKLNDHYATLGIHPQAAAEIGKQPGNNQQNPIDAGKLGVTKDNIAKKLQPGQFFTNPADGKVYQFKGPPKSDKKAIPDKPTNPEPINPMKPEKSPLSAMAQAGDDED